MFDDRGTDGKHAGHKIYRKNAGISVDCHRLNLHALRCQNFGNCTGQLGFDFFAATAIDEQAL